MLEHYFLRPLTLDQIRASWLAPQIERYVEWLHRQGYNAQTIRSRVPLLRHFAEFARARGAKDCEEAAAHVDEFTRDWIDRPGWLRKDGDSRQKGEREVRGPVGQMLRLASEGYVRPQRSHDPFPFAAEAPGFERHLLAERGLRPASVQRYANCLRKFSSHLEQVGAKSLTELSPALLASFAIEAAPSLSRAATHDLCGTLRVFLRYCHRERIISEDLSAAVDTPRRYRLTAVPRAITWDEVRRMLEAVDRRMPCGRRDYAMLLLLVTYGLRAGEVARLTLDDIDWKRERLQVSGRKADHATAYPLASVVAEALVEYIRSGRPETTDRHLFLRAVAPRVPITRVGVSSRVTTYLRKAGVQVPSAGSHTLRHTCVQRLIEAEFPLKAIGDYVGHRSPEATAVYAKVSLNDLREVALGDGEEL